MAKAQRAKQKKRVKNIHAKIRNRRKDALHKFSTRLVKDNALIVVGNVSSSGLAKTKMAKSVLDAGWAMLKTKLDYKSKGMRVVFMEVDEKYTTQTCSCCGGISDSSPKGRAGLRIREWTCAWCGTLHDRESMQPGTFSRPGMAVSQEESPIFRPGRMSTVWKCQFIKYGHANSFPSQLIIDKQDG